MSGNSELKNIGKKSRVQDPGSRVQGPGSRVQGPERKRKIQRERGREQQVLGEIYPFGESSSKSTFFFLIVY